MYPLLFIILFSFSYSLNANPDSYNEIAIGTNYPTAEYDKYADQGFSARFTHSRAFNRKNDLTEGLFKWQVGFQYISFRSSTWYDSFTMDSGLQGPTVMVTNSEQGYVFNGGFRFAASNGLNLNGNFRPYVGLFAGMSLFNEKTYYDWGDDDCSFAGWIIFDVLLDGDYCEDTNNSTNVNDRSWSPTFTLDLGTNIFFNEAQDVGMDIGIRYNMLTRLKRPETVYDDTQNTIDKISSYINADYYTFYIGVTWMLNANKSKKKNRRDKGKLI